LHRFWLICTPDSPRKWVWLDLFSAYLLGGLMRDARILTWLLADPGRRDHVRADQLAAVRTIAVAEGLADVLDARLAGQSGSAPSSDPVADLCHGCAALFGAGNMERGLYRLWQINSLIVDGQSQPGFWDAVQVEARQRKVTAHVSRALRLCHHLFETPVDAYLAWQGQRGDIFFLGRLLARNGAGKPTAPMLRLAFKLRAAWLARLS
jgi:hypothetical protein